MTVVCSESYYHALYQCGKVVQDVSAEWLRQTLSGSNKMMNLPLPRSRQPCIQIKHTNSIHLVSRASPYYCAIAHRIGAIREIGAGPRD